MKIKQKIKIRKSSSPLRNFCVPRSLHSSLFHIKCALDKVSFVMLFRRLFSSLFSTPACFQKDWKRNAFHCYQKHFRFCAVRKKEANLNNLQFILFEFERQKRNKKWFCFCCTVSVVAFSVFSRWYRAAFPNDTRSILFEFYSIGSFCVIIFRSHSIWETTKNKCRSHSIIYDFIHENCERAKTTEKSQTGTID